MSKVPNLIQSLSFLGWGSADWNTLIVGKLSPWIRPDSKVEKIRRNSEAVSLFDFSGFF